jgi:hypothetical protein
MARHTLTKAEVVTYCREVFRENPDTFRGDVTAKREFFNNYTDSLCKDRRITSRQYETWGNPF